MCCIHVKVGNNRFVKFITVDPPWGVTLSLDYVGHTKMYRGV